ncbi:MAG: DUF1801 domain-containing protein [Chloroflexota bacterium]|nr:DUF1801 domain-containing protein [Chloroflexota bacterium]
MPTKQATRSRNSARKSDNVFTDEERAAVQETARERKSRSRLSPEEEREAGEQEVRAKIAEMPAPDREMGKRIHAIVTKTAPVLVPRTYYGMPAWARDGKVICFFKPASKFKVRYATFEFQADASLDDGDMWPVSFAVDKLTSVVEARIAELVKKAAG